MDSYRCSVRVFSFSCAFVFSVFRILKNTDSLPGQQVDGGNRENLTESFSYLRGEKGSIFRFLFHSLTAVGDRREVLDQLGGALVSIRSDF